MVAHDAGSSVPVLEKPPTSGGTSATSEGGVRIINNSLAGEARVATTGEEASTYLRRVTEGQSNHDC